MLFLASGVYSVGGRILGGNPACVYLEQKKHAIFMRKQLHTSYISSMEKLPPPPCLLEKLLLRIEY